MESGRLAARVRRTRRILRVAPLAAFALLLSPAAPGARAASPPIVVANAGCALPGVRGPSLSLIDPDSLAVRAHLPLPWPVTRLLGSADGGFAWFVAGDDAASEPGPGGRGIAGAAPARARAVTGLPAPPALGVLDAVAGRITGWVALHPGTCGMVRRFGPGAPIVVVMRGDRGDSMFVHVVDATHPALVATLAVRAKRMLLDAAVTPGDFEIITVDEVLPQGGRAPAHVRLVDGASGAVRAEATLADDPDAREETDAGALLLWSSRLQRGDHVHTLDVRDAHTLAPIARVELGTQPMLATADPGTHALYTLAPDSAHVPTRWLCRAGPGGLARLVALPGLAPTGLAGLGADSVLVVAPDSLRLVSGRDGARLAATALPFAPGTLLRLDGEPLTFLVTEATGGRVARVDLAAGRAWAAAGTGRTGARLTNALAGIAGLSAGIGAAWVTGVGVLPFGSAGSPHGPVSLAPTADPGVVAAVNWTTNDVTWFRTDSMSVLDYTAVGTGLRSWRASADRTRLLLQHGEQDFTLLDTATRTVAARYHVPFGMNVTSLAFFAPDERRERLLAIGPRGLTGMPLTGETPRAIQVALPGPRLVVVP